MNSTLIYICWQRWLDHVFVPYMKGIWWHKYRNLVTLLGQWLLLIQDLKSGIILVFLFFQFLNCSIDRMVQSFVFHNMSILFAWKGLLHHNRFSHVGYNFACYNINVHLWVSELRHYSIYLDYPKFHSHTICSVISKKTYLHRKLSNTSKCVIDTLLTKKFPYVSPWRHEGNRVHIWRVSCV